jgi:hypothetical protein
MEFQTVQEMRNVGRGGWIRCHVREDIGKAYVNYFTHHDISSTDKNGILRRLFQMAKAAYLHQQFGYNYQGTVPVGF